MVADGRRLFSVLGAFAILAAALSLPARALAVDATPTPTPVVLHQPHYLVFMESHDTYNGPVEDGAYWLYPYLPDGDAGTHFAVPDGGGLLWHYTGSVVGGPFTTDADACPAMLAVGVESLTSWVTMAGEQQQVVDCSRFAASPEPSTAELTPGPATTERPAGTVGAGATSAPDGPQVRGSEPTDEDIGLAVALIGFLLFGGGAAAAAAGRGGPTVMEPPPAEFPAATEEPPTTRARSLRRAGGGGREGLAQGSLRQSPPGPEPSLRSDPPGRDRSARQRRPAGERPPRSRVCRGRHLGVGRRGP